LTRTRSKPGNGRWLEAGPLSHSAPRAGLHERATPKRQRDSANKVSSRAKLTHARDDTCSHVAFRLTGVVGAPIAIFRGSMDDLHHLLPALRRYLA